MAIFIFWCTAGKGVMRTGSSIPQLAKLTRRSANLARRSSDAHSAHLEVLDTIGEDELDAPADEVSAALP